MNTFDLEVCREEVLRYLGYKGQTIDENINTALDECISEVKRIIAPRAVYMYKDIKISENEVEVLGSNLILTGNDIRNHLINSKKCVLMAVTLGNDIEKRIRLYEKMDLTKALILDACATTAVEEVCDIVQQEIKAENLKNNQKITFRYSPGYGDLPLDIQNNFLRVLDAYKKIGLTVSSNNLLIPRKSVTAIIGIVDNKVKIKKKSCQECSNYKNCSFRREGENCGA